ncbi:ketol-acid reductoisomerase [Acidimicrobiaceae bacterium USS-CC1]|uniref:Ketol-acid reductoisomerase n=1 Tax=Acidiferrimicrobium australe TaxID=2664430 RepID=A0ABW9QUA6_9ACTN|nr:ketol-acid reductoisomerase [Acidiferrimicrobium australe]
MPWPSWQADDPTDRKRDSAVLNQVYRDDDADLRHLSGRTVAVLGYGIQGRAQALCLRDSQVQVLVGTSSSPGQPSWEAAELDGFPVMSIAEATKRADVLDFLVADPAQPTVYEESIGGNLSAGQTLVFGHGFNVLYGLIQPPADVNVTLFVPNGPGHVVREKYLAGSGIYGAVAVEQDATGDAMDVVLAVAKGVGSTRVGVVEVDFCSETEGDNFEEQVLYGGTIALMRATFEVMVEHGYPPYFAYAKAIRSLRSVVDVMDDLGIEEYISRRSSRTCEFAVRMTGPRVVNRAEIERVFEETSRGDFAADWVTEWQRGMMHLHRMRRTGAASQMEQVGREWRDTFGR